MERTQDWLRGTARIAWWDGSALDLRLPRLTDLIDALAGAPDTDPVRVPAPGRDRLSDRIAGGRAGGRA